MANLTIPQTIQILQQAGFAGTQLVSALATVMAENGALNPGAVNVNSGPKVPAAYQGSLDQGLFQINNFAHPDLGNPFDPLANAKYAYALSSGGSDFSAWSTWAYDSAGNLVSNALASIAGSKLGQAAIAVTNYGGSGAPYLGSSPTPAQTTIGNQLAPSLSNAIGGVLVPSGPPTTTFIQANNTVTSAQNSLGGIATSLGAIAANIGNFINNGTALVTFLNQPDIYLRLGLGLLGGLLIVVGLVFFGLSFNPHVPSEVSRAAALVK